MHAAPSRRTWTWPTEAATTVPGTARIACWGHYGRPVLWLGPGATDHLQPARYGLVGPLEPFLSQGRLKLYATDVPPSEPGRLIEEVLPRMHADSALTTEGFGIIAADEACGAALALMAMSPLVERLLLLEPAPVEVVPPPRRVVRVVLAEATPSRMGQLLEGRLHDGLALEQVALGNFAAPGWERWRTVVAPLVAHWLDR